MKAYIDLVLEKSTLRRLISASQDVVRNCYMQQTPARELLVAAEKAIFDIAMNRTEGDTLKPLNEILLTTYDMIAELDRCHGEVAGVPTGFVKEEAAG